MLRAVMDKEGSMNLDTKKNRSTRRIRPADLMWPVVSLGAVMWSLILLFNKLEAEVSSDPVIRAILIEGNVASDARIVVSVLAERLGQIPAEALVLASLASLVAYAALAWYDRIALMHLGKLREISWGYVALCSFVTYALGHNLGASMLSGAAVRLRAYAAKGLTRMEVGVLVGMCSFTFAYGTALLLGLVLVIAPEVLEPLASVLPALSLSEPAVRGLGAALLCTCLVYVLGALLGSKPWQIGPLRLSYPRLGVVLRQVLAAPLEIAGAAGIIYFALPEVGNPGYLLVLGAFLISFSVGLASQVPGGVGVMEAVFLALMPGVPATSVLAALLVWRLLYLLIPLALSGPIILAFERGQLARARG
jgi:glycosyltransferase 2 family protein